MSEHRKVEKPGRDDEPVVQDARWNESARQIVVTLKGKNGAVDVAVPEGEPVFFWG